jgi:hypothetical protein
MENEKALRSTIRDFSKVSEIVQTVLIYLTALLVPLFLGQILKSIFTANNAIVSNSQYIIGSIVNTALVVSALNLKGRIKNFGVITMPSIATILGGYVFGTSSTLLVWMIPAIWIGNFAYVYAFKKIKVCMKKNYFLAGIVGIAVKVAVIFGVFSLLNLYGIFPPKMVGNLQMAMGLTQLVTATIGMLIGFGIYKLETRKNKVSE